MAEFTHSSGNGIHQQMNWENFQTNQPTQPGANSPTKSTCPNSPIAPRITSLAEGLGWFCWFIGQFLAEKRSIVYFVRRKTGHESRIATLSASSLLQAQLRDDVGRCFVLLLLWFYPVLLLLLLGRIYHYQIIIYVLLFIELLLFIIVITFYSAHGHMINLFWNRVQHDHVFDGAFDYQFYTCFPTI